MSEKKILPVQRDKRINAVSQIAMPALTILAFSLTSMKYLQI
jgi:hypothetical protein